MNPVCSPPPLCTATPTAAQGRVTSPWCGGETGGGSPGLTRNLGGDLAQPRRPDPRIARPTPRRPPWDSPDGTGRAPPGGGGMREYPGSPVTQPSPGLVCIPLPQPMAHCILHMYIMGGDRILSNARPGLGLHTMAFGQGTDVTGGYRSCPAMQCGTPVTLGLTTTRPGAPGGWTGPKDGRPWGTGETTWGRR